MRLFAEQRRGERSMKSNAFGKKLNSMREAVGLTQEQVADVLGCSTPRISEWERGVRTPKPATQVGIFSMLETAGKKKKKK